MQNKKPNSGIDAYKRTNVMTSNRETILLMLYSGAIRFLKSAEQHAQSGDLREKGEKLVKAQAIINELRSTLNFDVGDGLAEKLDSLYSYITSRLLTATLEKDTAPISEAIKILETLNEGWEQAIAQLRKEQNQETKSGG